MKIRGLPVKDANKELHVIVTPADVKYGATKNAHACAAVLALMRHPGCSEAIVHTSRTYVKQGKKWIKYATPTALRSEVVAFDRGGKFEPGEYRLLPISESQRTGKRALRTPSPSGDKKGGKKRKQHITTGVRRHMDGWTD